MNDRISIIIPTRNRWDLLFERAAGSILKQAYQNWELIIVDDGSDEECPRCITDKERIKIYRIEKTYPYPKDNKKAEWLAGPCLALNEALKHVTGDWIYRCDDDDILLPDCLEFLLRFAQEGNYDFVSALWKDKNDLIGMPEWIKCHQVGGVQTWLYKANFKDVLYNPECWKKKWNAVNDWDWFERFVKAKPYPNNKKIGFLPRVVVSILPRTGNSMIGSQAYIKENRWDLKENHLLV